MSLQTVCPGGLGYLVKRHSRRKLTPAQRKAMFGHHVRAFNANSWPCDPLDEEIDTAEKSCLAEIAATGVLTSGSGQTVETIYAQLGWQGSETFDGDFACTLDKAAASERRLSRHEWSWSRKLPKTRVKVYAPMW